MQRTLLILLFCLFNLAGYTQKPGLSWVKTMGGPKSDGISRAASDASGNIYIAGNFNGTSDFDPGPGISSLTPIGQSDVYIAKYNANGDLIWIKQLGGVKTETVFNLSTATDGSVLISGRFDGTVDFDPGPADFFLSPTGEFDAYILKLDAAGNFIWAKQMSGPGRKNIWSISIDPSGNLYLYGDFQGDTDIDPGSGVYMLSTPFATTGTFIEKLTPDGDLIWAQYLENSSAYTSGVTHLDPQGNLVVAGGFNGTVDFDNGPGVATLSAPDTKSYDMFILKLDANGGFIWVKQIEGKGTETANNLKIDPDGNIYISGLLSDIQNTNTTDFDPGPGVLNLPSKGSIWSNFVFKLNDAGDLVWAKLFSGTKSSISFGLATPGLYIDPQQNVYVSGSYVENMDFDPGPATYSLTSTPKNISDGFIACLSKNGDFVSVTTITSPGVESITELIGNANGDLYAMGSYSMNARFSPCSQIPMNSAGEADIFIAKFSILSVSITSSTTSICSGNPVTFTASSVNAGTAPLYQWMVNGTPVGTYNSTYTTSTLTDKDTVSAILIYSAGCPEPISDTSNLIVINVGSTAAPTVTINTVSAQVCAGNTATFNAIVTNGGTTPHFQWMVNGATAGTDNSVFSTATLQNNDEVSVRYTGNNSCAVINTALSNTLKMEVLVSTAPVVTVNASATSVCPGKAVNFSATLVNPGSGMAYHWKLNGNDVGTNSPAYQLQQPKNSDVVSCTVTMLTICSSVLVTVVSNQVMLNVYEVPTVTINPAVRKISPGQPAQLTATIQGNYQQFTWMPAGTLNDPSILNPVASPSSSTLYQLKVVTANLCTAEATAKVEIVIRLFLPASFTPNNDGWNDVFRIPPGSDIRLQDFSIYNRYGNLVFRTKDVNKGWDGTFKGEVLPAGNYIYFITGVGSEGKIAIKNNILLLR